MMSHRPSSLQSALGRQLVAGLQHVNDGAGGDLVHVLLILLGGAWQEREGAVVYRDDVPDAEEPSGVCSLEGAHYHLVADRQESEVRAVELPDQLHVAEDGGVSRVVELEAALELDYVAHRFAGVDHAAVVQGDARGVEGVGRRDLDPSDLNRAAFLDRYRVLDAHALEVGEDLEVRNGPGAGLSHERLYIREVIEVPVGDQDGIERTHALELVRGLGVLGKNRVYDDLRVTRSREPEGRVPQVGDPGPAQHVFHCLPPSVSFNSLPS